MISRMRGVALTPVLALCAVGACRTDDRAAEEWMPLQLASTEYRADTTGGELVAQVVIVYENPIDDPVHLNTCGPGTPWYVVERQTGDTWTRVIEPPCLAILTPPIVVGPGQSRTDTLSLRAALPAAPETAIAAPRFGGDTVAGTYRIVYDAYRLGWDVGDRGPDPAARLSAEQQRSAPFTLRP